MQVPLVSLESVSAVLGGSRVLCDLTWQIRPDEHWAVVGANGSGKSTLLRLLRGDQRPAQDGIGRITWAFDGLADTSPLAVRPLASLVGAEMQRNYIRRGWRINGFELILSGLVDNWLPSFHDEEECARAVAIAEALEAASLLEMPVTAMSQGQLRLMLVARALITRPRLLLLDEAFDGLDLNARMALDRAAAHTVSQGTTLVCTAHRAADLPACLTHVLALDSGKSVFLGPLSAWTDSLEPGETSVPHLEISVAPAARTPEFAVDPSSPVLEMRNAHVFVNRCHVLRNIDWQVLPGEQWRITGPNGSGKSTLLRTLAGLEQVALGGYLRWFGKQHPPLPDLHRHVGIISDLLHADYGYDLTGRELAWTGFDGSVGLYRDIQPEEQALAASWIDCLGLAPHMEKPLSSLSSGLARRFFLARALVASPRALLLDEPCSGMDAASRALFLAAVSRAMDAGVTCIYVSHHESDVPPGITHELRLTDGRVASIVALGCRG